jgi:hypothetical protein
MGYLIFTLGSIGTNGRGQLFYHTLGCNFYGLSRDGIYITYHDTGSQVTYVITMIDVTKHTIVLKKCRGSMSIILLCY